MLVVKERLGLFRRRTVRLDSVGYIVGKKAFIDTARSIAARSLVLVHDDSNAVRHLRAGPANVAVVSYSEANLTGGGTFATQLAKRGHQVTHFRLTPTSGPASYDSAAAVIRAAPTAIFAVAIRVVSGSGAIGMPAPLAELIQGSTGERPTVLVSFGSPYLERQVPGAQAFLLAWTANPLTEEAAAAALSGAAITGTLPITLGPDRSIGAGVVLEGSEGHGAPGRR
jgi:beta-N-acetylhexosaminidase